MKTRYILPNYSSDQLVRDTVGHKGPVRYVAYDVPMPLWRSILMLFRWCIWCRRERFFKPIYPGQPGYDEAIFEAVEVKTP